jgi:TRAP-type C4-dicarboxylate transport system permease small subunit
MKIWNFLKTIVIKADNLAAGILFANSALVVLNILLRSLFRLPIFGVYEIVCYASLIMVSLSLGNCSLSGAHTNLTLVVEKIPGKARIILEAIVELVVLINFLFITWNMGKYMQSRYRIGEVSAVLRLPIYILVGLIVLGFALLTLSVFIRFRALVKDLINPAKPDSAKF